MYFCAIKGVFLLVSSLNISVKKTHQLRCCGVDNKHIVTVQLPSAASITAIEGIIRHKTVIIFSFSIIPLQ